MLLLTNDDVRKVLSMKVCLEAIENGHKDLRAGDAANRPRIDVYSLRDRENECYRWSSMEGVSRRNGVFAFRLKSDVAQWTPEGTDEWYCIRPGTYCGLVFLFSLETAEPLAVMHDALLTHMWVGANAALGVKYLSRADSAVVGIAGSGNMARTYLEAFSLVRGIKEARIYSPTREHRESCAGEMSGRLGIPVRAVETLEEMARGADIVAAPTDSDIPVIRNPSLLEPGMHLTDVTNKEYAPEVISRCDLVYRVGIRTIETESLPPGFQMLTGGFASCVAGTPKELAKIPIRKGIDFTRYPTYLDFLSGKEPGRTRPEQITYVRNGGFQGLPYASVGGCVYSLCKEKGLGREIPTEWFLENLRD